MSETTTRRDGPKPSENGHANHEVAIAQDKTHNGGTFGNAGVIIGGNNIQQGVLVPQHIVGMLAVMGIQLHHGQKDLNSETIALLKQFGVQLPDSIKEISTLVAYEAGTRRIILPTGMDKLVASKELKKQWENEEQLINHNNTFEGWNWKDTLVAVKRTTESIFGWMNAQNIETWFGPIRPTEIDVVVDVQDGRNIVEKAFYGRFAITAWEDAVADLKVRNGEVSLQIEGKRKYASEVSRYFEEIRKHLETASIYRGKSLVVTKNEGNDSIEYEIIENKGSNKIFLNANEERVLDQFVIAGLPDPGKRTYLFTGSYGTGKTESAMKVGREATKVGMSFFYVKHANVFDILLNQSKKYQPCVVFVEDIDEITSGEGRDMDMNSILNTLDGVQTKGNDLTVIFTTNHINKINSALRRPGRIDLILQFSNPEKATQEKIYRSYFAGIEGAEELDYEVILAASPDAQGAVLAEIGKRAVMVSKRNGHINTDNVLAAITSIEFQLGLMQNKAEGLPKEQQFIALYKELIADPTAGSKLEEISRAIKSDTETIKNAVA